MTAWVTTPRASPAFEKLVENVGEGEVLPGGRGPGRASPHPRPHGPLCVSRIAPSPGIFLITPGRPCRRSAPTSCPFLVLLLPFSLLRFWSPRPLPLPSIFLTRVFLPGYLTVRLPCILGTSGDPPLLCRLFQPLFSSCFVAFLCCCSLHLSQITDGPFAPYPFKSSSSSFYPIASSFTSALGPLFFMVHLLRVLTATFFPVNLWTWWMVCSELLIFYESSCNLYSSLNNRELKHIWGGGWNLAGESKTRCFSGVFVQNSEKMFIFVAYRLWDGCWFFWIQWTWLQRRPEEQYQVRYRLPTSSPLLWRQDRKWLLLTVLLCIVIIVSRLALVIPLSVVFVIW